MPNQVCDADDCSTGRLSASIDRPTLGSGGPDPMIRWGLFPEDPPSAQTNHQT